MFLLECHLHKLQRPTQWGRVYGGHWRFLSDRFTGVSVVFLLKDDQMLWVWSLVWFAIAFVWFHRCMAPQSIHAEAWWKGQLSMDLTVWSWMVAWVLGCCAASWKICSTVALRLDVLYGLLVLWRAQLCLVQLVMTNCQHNWITWA